MKIERRGKYPGVKVHLDPEECEAFIKFADDKLTADHPISDAPPAKPTYFSVSLKIGKKMKKIMADAPDFLSDRTPEQVKESLLKDHAKIQEQLKAMDEKKDWKTVQ